VISFGAAGADAGRPPPRSGPVLAVIAARSQRPSAGSATAARTGSPRASAQEPLRDVVAPDDGVGVTPSAAGPRGPALALKRVIRAVICSDFVASRRGSGFSVSGSSRTWSSSRGRSPDPDVVLLGLHPPRLWILSLPPPERLRRLQPRSVRRLPRRPAASSIDSTLCESPSSSR